MREPLHPSVRPLWQLVRRVPGGVTLRDPDSGRLLSVERRGFVEIVAADPGAGTVMRYTVGFLFWPIRPLCDIRRAGEAPGVSWRNGRRALLFNDATGVMEVGPDELDELRGQLERAIA
ncbi:hypothetical protein J4573_26625 [Actinomadura barringtoniae]|uniref:Uncharacterized protein n=1 Tax=Actinomadura barringtoniae TaxID=1427535 RepID=A0A939PEE8_9ACTN|nr:hypothetical protein [Actinomadura barringtoniae]MBO2450707.1 hypothetical protein [Actinomadura barringtoniae]